MHTRVLGLLASPAPISVFFFFFLFWSSTYSVNWIGIFLRIHEHFRMPLGHSASAVKTRLSVGTYTVGHHVLCILPLVKDPNHDAGNISKRREVVLMRISPLYCMTGEKKIISTHSKLYLLFKILSALFFLRFIFYI